jgi:hypothetical protein
VGNRTACFGSFLRPHLSEPSFKAPLFIKKGHSNNAQANFKNLDTFTGRSLSGVGRRQHERKGEVNDRREKKTAVLQDIGAKDVGKSP